MQRDLIHNNQLLELIELLFTDHHLFPFVEEDGEKTGIYQGFF